MEIGLLGEHAHHDVRRDVLEHESGFRGCVDSADGLDLVFIGVSPAERFEAAASALRRGAHVLLEWPPTTSVRECARLVRLAEEAGFEVAVSRPLRPSMAEVVGAWRARVVSMEVRGASSIARALADAVDLGAALVQSGSVQRVEAEAAHDEHRMLTAAGLSIRYHNGAFGQVLIRTGGEGDGMHVYAAGEGREIERVARVDAAFLAEETRNVLRAVREGRPPPVSALDALQTLRVVERVMGVLR